MVLPWCCLHGTPMVLPWHFSWYLNGSFMRLASCFHDTSMVPSRRCMRFHCFHGASMRLPWCFRGTPMVFPWGIHGGVYYTLPLLPPKFHGTSIVSMVLPCDNQVAPMVHLWCFHAISMVLPWCFHGLHGASTVLSRLSWCLHTTFTVPPWYFYGASMGFPWFRQGDLMVLSWTSMVFRDFHGASMRLSWCLHGTSMVLPWDFHGVP